MKGLKGEREGGCSVESKLGIRLMAQGRTVKPTPSVYLFVSLLGLEREGKKGRREEGTEVEMLYGEDK